MRTFLFAVVLLGCTGADGQQGLASAGVAGQQGQPGAPGSPGLDGKDGKDGKAGKDGQAGQPGTVSGSRLKAIHRVGDDGSTEFIGWHDTMLDVDCDYGLAADGVERCLPIVQLSVSGALNAQNYFSDVGCTAMALLVDTTAGCTVPKYRKISASLPIACATVKPDSGTRYFPVGAAFPADPMLYAKSGSCMPVGPASTFQGWTLFALGPETTPDSFVASSIIVDP